MVNTNELSDKVVLFFACLGIYLVQLRFEVNVVPVIIVVIIGCLLSYLENDQLIIMLHLVYGILCFFMPPLIVFMPLFYYGLFLEKFQVLLLIMVVPMVVTFEQVGLSLMGTILVVLFISLWLKKRTLNFSQLKNQYNQLSDDARELSVQLKNQNKELSDKMDNDVNLATMKERNRIAREIHDNVGHQLSSAILQIGALLAVHKEKKIKEPLLIVSSTLSEAMTSIRVSVHDLHDQSVDLHMQIEAILNNFSFCEVIFEDQLVSQPEKKLKLAFIAITKEALSNIIKHSNAKKVHILLREHPAFYQLIIRDDGTLNTLASDSGIGLTNMLDRVHAFKGNINFTKEKGFEIFISIPKGGSI